MSCKISVLTSRLVTCLCLIALRISSPAQTTSSSVQGHIIDSNGEELSGVDVTLIYKPTNTKFNATSNRDGRFNFANLNPGGPYEFTLAFLGLKTENIQNVQLRLGEALKLEVTMKDETAQLSDITIAPTTTSTEDVADKKGSGTNISKDQIQSLPTLTRSFSDFTRLAPQSSNNSFAGTNFRYNNITLDGAINNDAIGFSPSLGGISGSANQPGSSTRTNSFSLDAIQEVQVQIAPYDVSIGNFTGGSINAVSRSGSNTVNGSVYVFGRNASLTGKYKGEDKIENGKINSSYYDYQTGFRVGLPVVKDKLFWFTNEEITHNSIPQFYPAGSPGYSVIKPGEATQIQNKLDTMKVYGGGVAGYNPGDTAKYNIYSKSVKFFNRIDWVINKNHTLALRNNTIVSEASNLERSAQEFQFGNFDFIQKNTNSSTVAELKSRFGNNLSNSLIIGYTDIKDSRNPAGSIFPQIQIGTSSSHILLGTNREAGIFNMRQGTFEFTDNVKIFTGDHTITLGTHNEFYKIDYVFINSWNGRFEYPNVASFVANQPSRLRALYDANDNSRGNLLNNSPAKTNVFLTSLYAQDEWVKGDLTLSFGLRADMPFLPTGPNGAVRNNFPASPQNYGHTYTYNTIPQISTKYFSQIYLSPRIGFTYDVKGDRSLIIRGGTGVFTGRIPFAWLGYTYLNNGSSFKAMDWRPAAGTVVRIPTDPSQFGNFNQSVALSPPDRTELDLLDKNFSLPRIWRSSLAADIKLGGGYSLTVEAFYTKTIKDIFIKQVNLNDNVLYAQYDTKKEQPLYFGSTTTDGTGNRVSDKFSSVYLISNTDLGYRYQITTQISKSYSIGINAMVAYTYGQSKDAFNGIRNSPESGWQLNQSLSPNNPTLAYSNFDIRHRILSTVQYKKTWGSTGASYVSLIYTSQSGSPFTYGLISNRISGNGQQTDLFYVPRSTETYYNLSAAQQTAFDEYIQNDKYLNSRRGMFTERNGGRTPWNNQLDLRLMHDFYFTSASRTNTIQITFDIINLSNMISKNWGVYYFTPNTFNSTVDVGLSAGARSGNPVTFGTSTFTAPKSTYSIDQFNSRWQAQLGVRYIF